MQGVPVIGDSARDLDAARAIGARPILVLTGNGKKTLASGDPVTEVFENLDQAANALISER
jgi:D-glycero-D-manno-heptose 1,7-bisphosphate phosphatase